jgi:hypothetical protein
LNARHGSGFLVQPDGADSGRVIERDLQCEVGRNVLWRTELDRAVHVGRPAENGRRHQLVRQVDVVLVIRPGTQFRDHSAACFAQLLVGDALIGIGDLDAVLMHQCGIDALLQGPHLCMHRREAEQQHGHQWPAEQPKCRGDGRVFLVHDRSASGTTC